MSRVCFCVRMAQVELRSVSAPVDGRAASRPSQLAAALKQGMRISEGGAGTGAARTRTGAGQGLTLVPISAQLELTLPLSAQQADCVRHITQRNPRMWLEGAQVEL